MRRHLEQAREIGMDFSSAWTWAWPRVRWDHDTVHRRDQKAVLEEHREVWRACYMREPASASMVMVGRLAEMIAD